MLLSDFVGQVMEQLSDFLPDGSLVEFRLKTSQYWQKSNGEVIYHVLVAAQEAEQDGSEISFTVPMSSSRCSVSATAQARQN